MNGETLLYDPAGSCNETSRSAPSPPNARIDFDARSYTQKTQIQYGLSYHAPSYYENSQDISNPDRILDMQQLSRLKPIPHQEIPHDAIRKDPRSRPLQRAFWEEDFSLGRRSFFRFVHFHRFTERPSDSIQENRVSRSGLPSCRRFSQSVFSGILTLATHHDGPLHNLIRPAQPHFSPIRPPKLDRVTLDADH